ncbi:MAG: phage major capsid protein [Phycisphaerales bacterium JB050]
MTLAELRSLIERHIADAGEILERAEAEGRSLTAEEKKKVADHQERAKNAREYLKAKEDSLGEKNTSPKTRSAGEITSGGREDRSREALSGDKAALTVRTKDGEIVEARSFNESLEVPGNTEDRSDMSIGDAVLSIVGSQTGGSEHRSMVTGNDPEGGFFVNPSLGMRFFDSARQQSRLLQAGALTVPMDRAVLDLALLMKDPDPAWRPEEGLIQSSDGQIGTIRLSAKSLAARVLISRELMMDAPNAASQITQALADRMSEMIDLAMLSGDGKKGAPLGLLNIGGMTEHDASGSLTYDDFIDANSKIRKLNIDPVSALMSPDRDGQLQKLKDTSGQYLQPPTGFTDLRRLATSAMPEDKILAGNFATAILGVRERFSVGVYEADEAKKGMVAIIAHARVDFGMARPERVCLLSNLG